MMTSEQIASFLSQLKFRRAVGGCDREDVYQKLATLDSMYAEYVEDQTAQIKSQMEAQKEQLTALQQSVETISQQNGTLTAEKVELQRQNEELRAQLASAGSAQDRYYQEQRRLSDAVIAVQVDNARRRGEIELERQRLLSEAQQKVNEITETQMKELEEKLQEGDRQLTAMEEKKTDAIGQLETMIASMSALLDSFRSNDAESGGESRETA